MARLTLKHITKIYSGGVKAVSDANVEINDGEFVVLIGPSGCGKSTLLRMIAGLEEITEGDLLIDGKRVNNIAPADRDIGMVFQNYALYGNMTVYDNIGISLAIRHKKADYIHEKTMKAAKTVELTEVLNNKPANLSGGQRQRVALGRTIVRDSSIILMDEPLSNLDAKLRAQTRREIVGLHNELGVTVVYVTHDQIEAMTMADRIVIINHGVVQQIGTPKELYLYPANIFVAGFIGSPPTNFITGVVKDNKFIFATGENEEKGFIIPQCHQTLIDNYQDKKVVLGIRPENISCAKSDCLVSKNKLTCDVELTEYLGAEHLVYFILNGKQMIARVSTEQELAMKQEVQLAFKLEDAHFFDSETEKRIN